MSSIPGWFRISSRVRGVGLIALWAILVMALSQSCGTKKMYPGPELPDEDVAVIKGSRTVAGIRIFFAGVDEDGHDDVVYKIEVPAGRRQIRIYFGTKDGSVRGMSR
ncbi:MAG: hypothetical protein JSW50_14570, partial [Candidatus Latescibacterota bacterium]